MATRTKSVVELILQAKVEGEKSLEQLTNFTSKLIEQQKEAEAAATSYGVKLEKLRATMDGLVRAENDLVRKGRLVESFKEQAAATSRADVKAKELIQTAKRLRAQLNATGEGGAARKALQAQFDKASVAAQKAVKSFQANKASLTKLSGEMKKAGLAAGNLAASERKLADEAGRIQAAQNATAESIGRITVKSNQAATAVNRFGKNSRTSLSLIQRLRGEVLALGAAYVGLFGIGREVGNVFGAVRQKEAIESRFRVAFDGDDNAAQKVEEELAFVRQTADKLKISFLNLGTQYSTFISAVPEGIFSLEQQRKIFLDIATAARVMRLSQEGVEGTFKAIIQIASKGTFQMEELRGQLGDRLPGALLLFAKRLNVSTRELDKMVEQGQVGADKLVELAEAVEGQFGGDLEKALAASTTQLDAFFLEIERLRLEIGEDSGFIDTLGESLGDLSEEIKKPEFKEGLTNLASLFGSLARAGVFLVQNIDAIKGAILTLIGFKVLGSLVAGFFAARKAALAFAGGLRALSLAGVLVSGPAGWLAALAVGIGFVAFKSKETLPDIEALRQKYLDLGEAADETGKKLSNSLNLSIDPDIQAIDKEIETVKTRFRILHDESERLKDLSTNNRAINFVGNLFGLDDSIAENNEEMRKASILLGAMIEKRAELSRANATSESEPERANLGLNDKQVEELEKAIAQANKEINKFEAVTLAQKIAQVDKAYAKLLETARGTTNPEDRAKQEAKVLEAIAAQKRSITLEEERKLLKEFARLEGAAAKQSGDTLQGRLDNIRLKYEDTINALRAIGRNTEADTLENTLASQISGELEKTKTKLRSTLTQLRAEDSNDLEARLEIVRQKYTKLIAALNAVGDIEGISLATDAQKQEEGAVRLAHAEEEINRLQEIREARLSRIQLQQEAGVLTAQDAQDQMLATVEELDPQLQGLLDKAIAMAAAMGDTSMVDNLKAMKAELQVSANNLDPFLVKMRKLKESFASGLVGAITDFSQGVKSAGEAFKSFARDFLIQVAQMILKQQILLAIQAMTGTVGQGGGTPGGGGGVGGFLSSLFHQGGIVGQGGGQTRQVSPLAFAGAYRYHSGGIAGLRPDETGAILKKGEEVLTENDSRHRNNGGGSETKVLQPMIFQDMDSLRQAVLASPEGVELQVTIQSENPEKFNNRNF